MIKCCFLIIMTIFSTSTFLISGCARNVSPNTYEAAEAGVASKVVHGVIIGKRKVKIDANSGAGGLAGAASGAAGGSAVGRSTQGHIAGAVGGAVVGGIVGHTIEKSINSHQGYEYIIKLKNDSTIAITQMQDLQFEINQPVLVIYGAMTRIVPDNTVEIKHYQRPQNQERQSKKRVKNPKEVIKIQQTRTQDNEE